MWRRYRDYFYVANMHGYDWAELRRRYEPLVEQVGHRADLNYVIAEMISELTVQHAYIEGGDLGSAQAAFRRASRRPLRARRRIGALPHRQDLRGKNEEERYRSPLTEVGVDVHVGDYVLAINGRELEGRHRSL